MNDRRRFLSLASCLAAAMFSPRFFVESASAADTTKKIIVVFLRGGADGLNCVIPHADDNYHRLRPTIRIPAPTSGSEFSALNLDGFFGLHPALPGFRRLYDRGSLAIFPAVHYPAASRSHFDSQSVVEHAGHTLSSGWLSRYISEVVDTSELDYSAVALGPTAPDSLKGALPPRVLNTLEAVHLSASSHVESLLRETLQDQYRPHQHPSPRSTLTDIRASGALALYDMEFLRSLGAASYIPANGAHYPDSELGNHLRDAAFLIKNGVGLRVATIDVSGWDTHIAQGNGVPSGRHARALSNLDACISAFMLDLGTLANSTAVIVMTEFGRTVAENASGGTDHGGAGTWFVVGGAVRGGIFLGAAGWPGLSTDQLRDGRDLMHTYDFRDVLAAVLVQHGSLLPSSLDLVLPNTPGTTIALS